jgi:competence ComEA-like helix-hairpin-helix protein
MRLRQIIREYFLFSKGERTGLTILIILMIIILIADRLIFYFEKPAVADKEKFDRMLGELKQQESTPTDPGSLFHFDPNTIDSAALDCLALPSRVKQNLLRYRMHGGRLKKKEDLRKIYGMNDSVYTVIEAFMNISEEEAYPASVVNTPEAAIEPKNSEARPPDPDTISADKIEINRATVADLMKLYGIGPVLSDRIVKYRNLVGGFHSLDQLTEVYGLKEETLQNIVGQLEVDSTALVPVNINFADARALANHPYLKWDDANRIVRYREKTGFIADKYQLIQDSVLKNEVFNKIKPYLQTSD